jgi:tetratricopeptide (TPR) repeat protein
LNGAAEYLQTQNAQETAAYLDELASNINMEETSEAFQTLYNTLLEKIGPEMSQYYFTLGNTSYQSEAFDQAIPDLVKAVGYDATNGDALFTLGNAYRRGGYDAEAIETYEKVVELFPGTERARRATRYINEINGE